MPLTVVYLLNTDVLTAFKAQSIPIKPNLTLPPTFIQFELESGG
jgi:hypothetical protein